MSEYQLEIKQIVDYPRCRIYRQFIQMLLAEKNIRIGGTSGLFYYTVLCCYANFRTSYKRIDGISYASHNFDIWAAEVVLNLRETEDLSLKLIAASPHPNFENRWSLEWQKRYAAIMARADFIKEVCSHYSRGCYQIRNEWMVDHSARVIAVWNGSPSGTKNTVMYAKQKGVPVINVLKTY